MDYSTDRLLTMMRKWELHPEGNPAIVDKPAPEQVTLPALAERLHLTERGTRSKIRQAFDSGLLTFTYGADITYSLTDNGRRYVDRRSGRTV